MTPYEMGKKAYNDGDLRDENPFIDYPEHSEWDEGFDAAATANDMCDDDDLDDYYEDEGWLNPRNGW